MNTFGSFKWITSWLGSIKS